ncbi:MAG TPA: hypothetical protein VN155_18710 [Devosia sp.]|nr:hypothetical protein [Devosia sp.]
MAMASGHDTAPLRDSLLATLARELDRQGVNRVDVAALADAVLIAIETPMPPADEGKRPEDLNATNDD